MIYTMTLNPALDYVMHPNTLDNLLQLFLPEELHWVVVMQVLTLHALLNEFDKVTVAMGHCRSFTGNG